MRRSLRFGLMCLLLSAAARADEHALTAEQYTRADRLYGRAVAQCCLRKAAAVKLHKEIEQRVANGEGDTTILRDLRSRYGGPAIRFDEEDTQGGNWLSYGWLAAAGLLLGGWFGRGRVRGTFRRSA
ncbi:MAG: hypothetical protein KGN84_01175 [Acidobacteriota bacterium]|nr:hypothetical protein [Acidobacteriota bacterium]